MIFQLMMVKFRVKRLLKNLNNFWKSKLKKEFKVESYLELEFEKYYRKFIITPARGADIGAKKRYAGLVTKRWKRKY